jgi:hypothetical protein
MRRVMIALCLLALPVVVFVQDGRWKVGGDGACYFDASDSGPNQCEPGTSTTGQQSGGRWKLGEGGACYWDPTDSGPNQCDAPGAPASVTGRWKLSSDGSCYFDGADSGPNQCEPTNGVRRIRR